MYPAPIGDLNHMGEDTLASQYAVQTKSLCEHIKKDLFDTELSSFVSDLQKACNLN